jgi:hypothetical protein
MTDNYEHSHCHDCNDYAPIEYICEQCCGEFCPCCMCECEEERSND